jgi:integrase
VEQFADKFAHVRFAELSPNSRLTYGSWLKNHIIPYWGKRDLATISQEEVERFKAKIMEDLSAQSVVSALTLFKQVMRCAVEWGYLHPNANPCAGVKNPRVKRKEVDCLNQGEVARLLEHVEGFWRCFFTVAVFTGLREGELIAMKWANLSEPRGEYFVRENWNFHISAFQHPKTESSYAPVSLSPACLQALRQQLSCVAEIKLAAGADYQDNDLVFPGAKGQPLNPWSISRNYFHPALKRAGIREVKFHSLRHTCASLLIALGEDPKYVQVQLRHKNISTTFDTYGHLFPNRNREAGLRLDAAIFGDSRVG